VEVILYLKYFGVHFRTLVPMMRKLFFVSSSVLVDGINNSIF